MAILSDLHMSVNKPRIWWELWGSKLAIGSSASIILGCCAKARAIPTLCCCPPLNDETVVNALSKRPTRSKQSRQRNWSATGSGRSDRQNEKYPRRPIITLQSAVFRSINWCCWKIMPVIFRWSLSFLEESMRPTDELLIQPFVGRFRKLSVFSNDDLPAPEDPRSMVTSPLLIVRLISLSAAILL